MPFLALNHLDDHPLNANVMPLDAFEKLKRHIEATGDYPPLIVRRHPRMDRADSGRFQILDGHHCARALRALGFEQARCEVWEADDQRAIMLLLTLNRLHGEDDPRTRGELLEQVTKAIDIPVLTQWLPDDSDRINALLKLARPIAINELGPPPDPDAMPQAVTFFLNEAQRRTLFERLANVADDRSEALAELLHPGE
jgi:ParB-like chromosome segregation protein Spo0J